MIIVRKNTQSFKNRSSKIQQELVQEHAEMVKRIAHHLKGRLPQNVLVDDLIQVGMIGLLEAAKNFNEEKGATFETYAGIRIRGHMLDEVRRNDWVPRSVYKNARLISQAVRTIENRTGSDARDMDVAAELGVSMKDYHIMLKEVSSTHLYGFEDLGVTDDLMVFDAYMNHSNEPYKQVQKEDFFKNVVQVIDKLPEKERLVLSLYYESELNLKEIGKVLEVSESRVSQIHSQAMLRIKARLAKK